MRILLISSVVFVALAGAYAVFAQEEPAVEFPVAELGNCQSKEECHAYCDEVEHIEQCVNFAERHGLMKGGELEEAKKVVSALRQGAQLPGGCRNKEECEVYCKDGAHIEECIAFAEAAGFMSPEELEDAKRVAPLMARGEMPGGCRSREECEAYCSQDGHIEECAAFFEKAGFISVQEAEMFRKTGGRGPGDCRGREECEAFCNAPANQKVCFEFAKEHDLIPQEELQQMQEGIEMFKRGLQSAPPEVAQCLKETVGEDVLAKIEAGTFLPSRELGEHMRQCFETHLPNIIQQNIQEQVGGEVPPEAADCVQRILGDTRELQGPPTAEQEQRIREECFPQQQPLRPEGFEGSMPPEGEIPEEFREQYEQQFQEQFHQQFEQQFQEEYQRQLQQQSEVPQEFHEEESLPESSLLKQSFLGAVVEAMQPGLRILFPFLSLRL